MGSEFVAAHVWRVVKHENLASRLPLLNSFVPNLVWLPGQVAKLTDREGGIVQQTLQAMTYAVYRDAPVSDHLREIVAEAWELVPTPMVELEPFEFDELNQFEPTAAFYRTRSSRLASVMDALEQLERGGPIADRVVTTRYAAGLSDVPVDAREHLLNYLRRFVTDSRSATPS
jgi:hypothetical protein